MAKPTHRRNLEEEEAELDRIMQQPANECRTKRGSQRQEKHVLSQKKKEAMAAKSYVESQEKKFERRRMKLDNDWKARNDFSIEQADELVGESNQCRQRRDDKLKAMTRLQRDLAIADHEYHFVRLDGEGDDEAEQRVKTEQDRIDLDFNTSARTYGPKVVDPAILAKLRGLGRSVPRWLYCVSSWQGTKSTNGHDQIHFHLPAAYKNNPGKKNDPLGWNYFLARTMDDEYNDLGQLVEKLGRRLLWLDRKNDPTLSWTSSLLFAIVLATARLAKEQQYVVIHVIDTAEVRRFDDPGAPVEFFLAQDLIREFDVQGWSGWGEHLERPKLRKPYYTHEWISHHAVYVPPGSERFAYEAKLEDLIEGGLYSLVPELRTTEEDDMKGLYHRCVYTRSLTHRNSKPAVKPISPEDLEISLQLAKCFKRKNRVDPDTRDIREYSGTKYALVTPYINFVLDLLGMHERPKQNPVLQSWAQSGFGGLDFSPAGFHGLVRVPNNIPEQMQTVDLARELCQVLHAGPLPQTQVWLADSRFNWHGKWLLNDIFYIKIRQADPKNSKKGTKGKKRSKGQQDDDQPGASETSGTSNETHTTTPTSTASPDEDPDGDETPARKRQKTDFSNESPNSAVDSATDPPADSIMSDAQGGATETSETMDAEIEVNLETA